MQARRRTTTALCLGWLWLALPPAAAPISLSGSVAGRVTLGDGSAATGAEVVATSPAGRSFRTRTGRNGYYALVGLPPGEYRVAVSLAGVPGVAVEGVRVRATHRRELDVSLEANPPARSRRPTEPVQLWDSSSPSYGTAYGDPELQGLPLPRNLWRVLENLDPAVVTDRFDVGGIWTGRPALVGTHGSSWVESSYFFEGMDLTDPFQPGKPMLYADYDALSELQVSTAAHDLPARAPGAAIYLTTREAGKRWQGRLYGSFQGQGIQFDNRGSGLRALGYERPWEFQNFGEFNVRAGGPLSRAWRLYLSAGTQQLSFRIPRFDAVPVARVFSGLVRLDFEPASRHHIHFLWTGQNLRNRHLDGFPTGTELITVRERHRHQVVLGRWEFRPGGGTAAEWHFLYAHTNLSNLNPKEAAGPHRRALFQVAQPRTLPAGFGEERECEGVFCGDNSTPFGSNSPRTRLRLGASLVHQLPAHASLRQQLHLQGYWSGAWTSNGLFTNEDIHLLSFQGAPTGVVQWNTPVRSEQRLHEGVLAGEHRLNFRDWLYVRWGLLLDHSRVSLPPQASPAGRFAPPRQFPARGSVINWTSLSPRAGLSLRLGPWNTMLRASYARYHHPLAARMGDFGNPNALSGRYLSWNDLNGDLEFQSGEEGTLLRRFGGRFSRIDPGLERPFTDEFSLGVDHALGSYLRARVRFFRRDAKHLIETVNEGVPFSAFRPMPFLDPGEDGLPGTADDRTLVVFNQDGATLGNDFFLLTNPGFRSVYKGFEIVLEKPWRNRWMLRASFLASQARGPSAPGNSAFVNDAGALGALFSADLGSPANDGFESLPHLLGTLFDNPNTLINADGRLFFDRGFAGKLAAAVEGPWSVTISSVAKYFDGLPFARRLVVTGLNQGPIAVLANRHGALRTEFNLSWDLRLQRQFVLRNGAFSTFVDIFNLLNLNNNTVENALTRPGFARRDPIKVQQPRVLRIGFYYSFGGRPGASP